MRKLKVMGKYCVDTKAERDMEAIASYNAPILSEIQASKELVNTNEMLFETLGCKFYESEVIRLLDEIEALKNDLIPE